MKKRILIFTLILIATQGFSQVKTTSNNPEYLPATDTSKTNKSLEKVSTSELRAFEIKTSNPLYYLLGKEVFGKEAFAFTSSLGISEKESFQDIRHLQYFASGVEIVYNVKDEKITSIFLLAPNYNNWYEPYTGKLPFGLNWNMTKSEVEHIIGYGTERQLMSDIFYQYKHHKVEIAYFKGSENPKMESIQIRDFEE